MNVAVTIGFIVVGAGLLAGSAVKSWGWVSSLRWALVHGHDYAVAVQAESSNITRKRRMELILDRDGGGVWPGAKSAQVWRHGATGWRRIFQRLYLATPIFLGEVAIFVIAVSIVPSLNDVVRALAVFLAFWLCAYAIMLILEAIVWYIIAKDYALVWGDIKFATSHQNRRSKPLGDFKGLGAVIVTAVLACTVLISAIAQLRGGFAGLLLSSNDTLGVRTLVSSFYYVISTMTTVGDGRIIPLGTYARAGAALLNLIVLLTVGFVLSAVAARLQERS